MSAGPLKIGLLGMDYRSMSLFHSTISKHLQDGSEVVNVTNADLAVFDMDTAYVKEQWSAFKTLYPDAATIALSSKHSVIDDITCLRKPIDFTLLAKIINELLPEKNIVWKIPDDYHPEESGSQSVKVATSKKDLAEQMNDIDGNSSVVPLRYNYSNIESESNLFDPMKYLYSTLKEVVKEAQVLKKYRKIMLWNQKYLIIDPINNRIITDMSNGVLRSVCLTAVNNENTPIDVTVTNQNKTEQDIAKGKTATYSINALIWFMAILSSRGRVPETVNGQPFDRELPIYLLHWPNFTRLEPVPHAQNIVSLWIKQPRSISSLANALNIDEKHVINLFVATQAIGLSGQAKRPGDVLFTPVNPVQHKQRGLFSSIMQKLQTIGLEKSSVAYSR